MRTLLLSATAAIAFAASPALAQDWTPGPYLRADVGVGVFGRLDPDAPTNVVGALDGELDYETALVYGGGFGYRTGNGVRFEFQVLNQFGDLEFENATTQLAPNNLLPPGTTIATTGDLHTLTFMANVLKDFNNEGRIQPFIGAGVGAARATANAATVFSVSPNGQPLNGFDDQETGFAYNFLAGVGLQFTRHLTGEIGYRWLRVPDLDFSTRSGVPFLPAHIAGLEQDADLGRHQFSVGLRWHFGAAPPPPPPPPPAPGPGGTPFTPPAAESSPFIPTPTPSASSPFLTPPPAPYVTGPAPTPMAQPFEPPAPPEPEPAPPAPPEAPKAPAAPAQKGPFLGEITDQNYLTILGRALDLVGWSDEQADSFSVSRFKVPHWDELGRSQAEVLIEHLLNELQNQMSPEA